MGITWRIAMPLLSTLAALVIIVHSAEEDQDRDYRYDIRPRSLDTGTPNHDQPWRVMEVEPMMKPSTQADTWRDFPEEPRRRPVRKRKRRPLPSSSEGFTPQERNLYTDDPKPYEPDHKAQAETDQPRRRRRKPETRRNRWTEDYLETGRPLRRRGLRRKRPSLENWPQLSEFNEYRSDEITSEEPKQENNDSPTIYKELFNEEFVRTDLEKEPDDDKGSETFTDMSIPEIIDPFVQSPLEDDYTLKQDHSLSEFSMEETSNNKQLAREELMNLREKLRDKSTVIKEYHKGQEKIAYPTIPHYVLQTKQTSMEEVEERAFIDLVEITKNNEKTDRIVNFNELLLMKPQTQTVDLKKLSSKLITPYYAKALIHEANSIFMDEEFNTKKHPIDPVTLKEILKRSNGASLSEILQQHNLSLADLLHGRENAISVLKSEDKKSKERDNNEQNGKDKSVNEEMKDTTPVTESVTNIIVEENLNETSTDKNEPEAFTTEKQDIEQKNFKESENGPKLLPKRRFQGGVRRKLRMRPMLNNTFKGQLNRDLIALTARKYLNHRNASHSKSKEWRNVMPVMINATNTNDESSKLEVTESIPTTTSIPEETTIIQNTEYYNPTTVSIDTETTENNNYEEEDKENDEVTTEIVKISTVASTEPITTEAQATTEKPKISRNLRPAINRMGLRQQAFNNRLKKKRMRQKNSTTEPPKDDLMQDLFGMPYLVSSSEFIARTQTPKSFTTDSDESFTSLDDFITTEKSRRKEKIARVGKNNTKVTSTTSKAPTIHSTTEETAKFEIEEILNDTRTSVRLSRILMERNMTLSELVEHRERGSSHVHLADIFHNASKEPNPPEPFLSKSLIEPISKETYPLRALLEANPNAKATTVDPNILQTQFVNIPVVMDFGNNVNENGENMGIMSLFNKLSESDLSESTVKKDSEGTPYVTTVIEVNTTNENDTVRESRVLKDKEDGMQHDLANWNEILNLMRRTLENGTDITTSLTEEVSSQPIKKITLEEDTDGDGLIVLGDLQTLRDFDSNIASASEEKIEFKSYERTEDTTIKPGILDHLPSETRSVTVATASIVGLAMVLFLLTYGVFKWNQQRKLLRKKQNFADERIPTPVFENRKGHKNNCSTRSISPMLASSNIYTMNTLDSHNGKESPEYMWDTLRKPFQ